MGIAKAVDVVRCLLDSGDSAWDGIEEDLTTIEKYSQHEDHLTSELRRAALLAASENLRAFVDAIPARDKAEFELCRYHSGGRAASEHCFAPSGVCWEFLAGSGG